MNHPTRISGSFLGLAGLALAVLLAGCEANQEVVVSDFQLHRSSWDSLRVEASFERPALIGSSERVAPDSIVFQLYDGSDNTLRTTRRPRMSIPDVRLGSREPLMVEGCGFFEGQAVCEQAGLRASPKRVQVDPQVVFPAEESLKKGRYQADFVVERREFNADSWERIAAESQIRAHLLAYVENHRKEAVRLPIQGGQGQFHLARHDNYDDFSFYLNSRLYEQDSARVFFDLYAGLEGDSAQVELASIEQRVRKKSPEEHRNDVRFFAQAAAKQVLDQIAASGRSRATVYVSEWTYNHIIQQYQIEMELEWEDNGFFSSRDYRLRGTLQVGRGGDEARFQYKDGNRVARLQWGQQGDANIMRLASLQRPEEEEGRGPQGPLRTSRTDPSGDDDSFFDW